jgi:chromosome segregation ATPase
MIREQELAQVQNYVIQVLPDLLRQEPKIVTAIESMVAHQFPRRDEFAQLLEQVKFMHKDMDRRFELQREETKSLREETKSLREETKLLREDMDKRFEQQREDMDRRFESQREETELLREETKLLREETKLLREETKLLREDMDKRFEQQREDMDRRFESQREETELLREETKSLREEMKLLREDMDKRFEQQREETKLLREDMNKRFEQQHDELKNNKRRLIKLESAQQVLNNRMIGLDAWLKTTRGNLGTEKGQTLEEVFALALSYGLNNPDIKPESIRLRQDLIDIEGVMFGRKYFATEIDLIAQDGKLIVFEMKATAKVSDVDVFSLKVELVAIQNPQQSVSGVFICLGADDRVRQRCTSLGLEFVG